VGGGRLKQAALAPTGTVTVTYDYFTHSAGDFFGGKPSYPDVEYENVPTFTTTRGVTHRLTDVIDMRPIKNNTGTEFTGTGAVIENIPRNGDTIIVGTAKYWQPRIDVVSLSKTGKITHTTGETTFEMKQPDYPKGDMPLFRMGLLPYTFDKKEVVLERFDNRGYKMEDIRRLDNRLTNVEALTALTVSELKTKEITIEDPYDASLDRIKTGITGDTFKNNNQSDLADNDYRARINKPLGTVGVIGFTREVPLVYDSDLSVGTIKKQSTIWPKYTEEVLIDQAVASRAININSFDIGQHIGTGVVDPSYTSWTERKLVDVNYQVDNSSGATVADGNVVSSQGNQEEHDGQI